MSSQSIPLSWWMCQVDISFIRVRRVTTWWKRTIFRFLLLDQTNWKTRLLVRKIALTYNLATRAWVAPKARICIVFYISPLRIKSRAYNRKGTNWKLFFEVTLFVWEGELPLICLCSKLPSNFTHTFRSWTTPTGARSGDFCKSRWPKISRRLVKEGQFCINASKQYVRIK